MADSTASYYKLPLGGDYCPVCGTQRRVCSLQTKDKGKPGWKCVDNISYLHYLLVGANDGETLTHWLEVENELGEISL